MNMEEESAYLIYTYDTEGYECEGYAPDCSDEDTDGRYKAYCDPEKDTEEMYVCDCCSLLVANGDMCGDYEFGCSRDHKPMSNVENIDGWYKVYCDPEKDDMEDHECEGYAPDCSDPWHDETSPGWTCPGCGIVLGMFYDIWKIRK